MVVQRVETRCHVSYTTLIVGTLDTFKNYTRKLKVHIKHKTQHSSPIIAIIGHQQIFPEIRVIK